MTDEPKERQARTRTHWLAGRSDRREYWAYVAILAVVTIVLSQILPKGGSSGTTGALFVLQIRRFHDLGRSGWWSVALLAVQFALMIPLLTLLPDIGIVGAALISLAAIVGMGVVPGQPHENAFGPPRGRRSLKEIFS